MGKDGKPADFAPDNVPYQPKHYLKVSTHDLDPGDLVLVAGTPGITRRHALSDELEDAESFDLPASVRYRTMLLDVLRARGANDRDIALRNAGRIASIENYQKKHAGVLDAFHKQGMLAAKRKEEAQIVAAIAGQPKIAAAYDAAIAEQRKFRAQKRVTRERDTILEWLYTSSPMLAQANTLYRLSVENPKPDLERAAGYTDRERKKLIASITRTRRSIEPGSDRAGVRLFLEEAAKLPPSQRIDAIAGDIGALLDRIYASTKIGQPDAEQQMLNETAAQLLARRDSMIDFAASLRPLADAIAARDAAYDGVLSRTAPAILAALRVAKGDRLYPDANATLRVGYGVVQGVSPRDAVTYAPQTVIGGVLQKETGVEPFNSPKRLLERAAAKDFRTYADPDLDTLPVDFASTNVVTNGSSGSPTLNAWGELCGLAFDSNWEGVGSDYVVDEDVTRTVHVDSRYMLWIMDVVDGASNLLSEMGISTQSAHGYDPADLDPSTNACASFAQYANGGWLARNPIPGSFPRWGSFQALQERNVAVLHAILDELSAKRASLPDGSNEKKLAYLYASCMNGDEIDRTAIDPIRPVLDAMEEIDSRDALERAIAVLQADGIAAPFNFTSSSDLKNNEHVIAGISQSGLGLPEREYYFRDDDKSKQTRDEYVKHIATIFQLAGDADAAARTRAEEVMRFETLLAKASSTAAQLRDTKANYNPMSLAGLRELAPHIDWNAFLAAIDAPQFPMVDVGQPEFLRTVDRYIAEQPLAVWKSYLRWRMLHRAAPVLSQAFVDEDFRFYGAALFGRKAQFPRWRRCVSSVDNLMGQALGKLYVERTFSPRARESARTMIANLLAALGDEVHNNLPWMNEQTKTKALEKLAAFDQQIGYPDRWRDYSALTVGDRPYVQNVLAASRFLYDRALQKIGKPFDRTDWDFSQSTVNAENQPQRNQIIFPAGILQPPFFDPDADDAYNYGGIGAVIGHEIIHGFDDEGRRFDSRGNMTDWWTAEDGKKFDELASCVEEQFGAYDVGNGVHMNGKLVLGESIADLGGLRIAYAAYEKTLQGKPRTNAGGFTPEQRFFLGWARIWASHATPEFERFIAQSNEHPVARFRINGPLSNMPEFASAFQCAADSAMVRAKRCAIW
ncbi:MAG TPA: S46 family peptidase [Thermoanaerobaculia bacterium]|nr:S46 family peptidase [Thermoanaerobaculia bacterium]